MKKTLFLTLTITLFLLTPVALPQNGLAQCTEDDTGELDIQGVSIDGIDCLPTVVHIRVQNAPNQVDPFMFDLIYDTSKLRFTGGKRGALAEGFRFFDVNEVTPGTVRVGGFDDGDDMIPQGATGDVVLLEFRVLTSTFQVFPVGGLTNLKDDIADWTTTGGCLQCNCEGTTTTMDYSKGKSYVRFNHRKPSKDKASMRMCVTQAFCDAVKSGGVEEIVVTLDDCNPTTIPGSALKPNKKKTAFRAKTPNYTLRVNCKQRWLKILLKNTDLKDCVSSNPVKVCATVKDGSCLCAEAVFEEILDRKGRLKKLSLMVVETCTP